MHLLSFFFQLNKQFVDAKVFKERIWISYFQHEYGIKYSSTIERKTNDLFIPTRIKNSLKKKVVRHFVVIETKLNFQSQKK